VKIESHSCEAGACLLCKQGVPRVPASSQTKAERFYIIDTRQIVGNCALFWCPDGAGYTTQLEEAGLYSEADARSHRETDLAVAASVARAFAVTHVRVDRLRDQGGIVWPVVKR